MTERRLNTVYKVINKPLTIMGAARDLFFLSAVLGAGIFNLFGSLFGGLLIFGVGVFAGRYATQKDPQIIRILLASQKFRTQYDPLKFSDEPLAVDD
jgi:type IV secretory pathway TrbD component